MQYRHIHTCIYPRLHSQSSSRPCGAAMGEIFMPWLRSCHFLTCIRLWYVLKLNQRHLYAHAHCCTCITCISKCTSATSVSSCIFYSTSSNPYRIGKGFTDTCNHVLMQDYIARTIEVVRPGGEAELYLHEFVISCLQLHSMLYCFVAQLLYVGWIP